MRSAESSRICCVWSCGWCLASFLPLVCLCWFSSCTRPRGPCCVSIVCSVFGRWTERCWVFECRKRRRNVGMCIFFSTVCAPAHGLVFPSSLAHPSICHVVMAANAVLRTTVLTPLKSPLQLSLPPSPFPPGCHPFFAIPLKPLMVTVDVLAVVHGSCRVNGLKG